MRGMFSSCISADTLIQTRERGIIKAGMVQKGEMIGGRNETGSDVWCTVISQAWHGTGYVSGNFTPDATNSATGATIFGASYTVYETSEEAAKFPTAYIGCSGTACGTRVTTVTAGESKSLHAGNYLLVTTKSGYYTDYNIFTVSSSSSSVATQMVQVMNTNQDRVVLSWGSAGNRDLHVIDKNDRSKKCDKFTHCKSSAVSVVGGSAKLDKESSGPGVETTQLNGISNGTVEVWVSIYSGTYTQALVDANPSVIQVYCFKCEFSGLVKEGYLTTVFQSWSNAPMGAKWWKAGEFTAPGTAERAKWTTCFGSSCWDTSNAAGPTRGLRTIADKGAVTNEKHIVTRADEGAVANEKQIVLPELRYCNDSKQKTIIGACREHVTTFRFSLISCIPHLAGPIRSQPLMGSLQYLGCVDCVPQVDTSFDICAITRTLTHSMHTCITQ